MKSLGRFPRVLNVLPREKIEGPQRDFLKANRGHIQGQTKGQKPEGPSEGSIHRDTSEAFPQIFIIFTNAPVY